ncbi:UNVERIFIED_CONTAM: hypothetical protein RMT77_013246 [Armadillidium vulgare]
MPCDMSISENKEKIWGWFPSLIVYDTELCSKEEHDPAKSVLYYRPRNLPTNLRTIACGQIAGVVQFCRSAFSDVTLIKTKNAHFALKNYGRFVLMMTGNSKEWTESHLLIASQLLDASVGGISLLWKENRHNPANFVDILTSVLDAIVFHALHDIRFEDGIYASDSVSTSLSSGTSPSSDLLEDLESEKSLQEEENGTIVVPPWRRKIESSVPKCQTKMEATSSGASLDDAEINERTKISTLNREFTAIQSVSLLKSGGLAFLKANQLFEVCQQHSGVLAGSIFFENRVLATQLEPALDFVISSLNDINNETNEILQKREKPFELPKGVALYTFNLTVGDLISLNKSVPKIFSRKGRKSIRNEVQSKDLFSIRSALQNQSLHSYPSSIPPLNDSSFKNVEENIISGSPAKPLDPLLLCAKLNRNNDLLSESRPSKSLPGSPRKIRVSTMLPDVGRDSPDLRFKILTAKRHKPGISSNNTPRKIPSNMLNNITKNGSQNNSNGIHKGLNFAAPLLKRKDYACKNDSISHKNLDKNFQLNKENINYDGKRFIEETNNKEINIKNTKNKLNLQFAPEKINRPQNYYENESKISREINGNLAKDQKENSLKHCSVKSCKASFFDLIEDEDASRSEESEISVLELSSFLDSKENGNRMFAEATRMDSPKSDISENEESSNHYACCEEENSKENLPLNHWTKVVLYSHKTSKMAFFLLIDKKASDNHSLIYNLYQCASSCLMDIEGLLEKSLEISEDHEGETYIRKIFSILTSSDLGSLSLPLVKEAHRDFTLNPHLTEITLRKNEKIVWAHKSCEAETYFQSKGIFKAGLPIPSDEMSRISHRARRRLERDYGITIL